MWASKYTIHVITSKGSWYESAAQGLVKTISRLGFKCNLLFSHKYVLDNSVAFYLSYTKIVPVEYINKTYQSLVVHASDLPQGKGFSPWVWQILEGKNSIPLSLFKIVESLDAGPILLKDFLLLNGTELLQEIRYLLSLKIQEIIIFYLCLDTHLEGIPQEGVETFYRKRNQQDSELDIKKSIEEQFNLLRVVDNINYPAYFIYKGKKYIININKQETS